MGFFGYFRMHLDVILRLDLYLWKNRRLFPWMKKCRTGSTTKPVGASNIEVLWVNLSSTSSSCATLQSTRNWLKCSSLPFPISHLTSSKVASFEVLLRLFHSHSGTNTRSFVTKSNPIYSIDLTSFQVSVRYI